MIHQRVEYRRAIMARRFNIIYDEYYPPKSCEKIVILFAAYKLGARDYTQIRWTDQEWINARE